MEPVPNRKSLQTGHEIPVKKAFKTCTGSFFIREIKLLTPDELKMSFFFWYIGVISEDELIEHIRGNLGLKASEELRTKIIKKLREIKFAHKP